MADEATTPFTAGEGSSHQAGLNPADAVAASLAELAKNKPRRQSRRHVDMDAVQALGAAIPASRGDIAHVESPSAHTAAGESHSGDEEGVNAPTSSRGTRRAARGSQRAAVKHEAPSEQEASAEASPRFSGAAFGAPLFTAAEAAASPTHVPTPMPGLTSLLFQEPDLSSVQIQRREEEVDSPAASETSEEEVKKPASRRRSRRRSGESAAEVEQQAEESDSSSEDVSGESAENEPSLRRSRRRTRAASREEVAAAPGEQEEEAAQPAQKAADDAGESEEELSGTRSVRRRRRRRSSSEVTDEVAVPKGSTRLEAKRLRRKEGREAGRRRHTITESEYLARRESVKREMLVREKDGLNQIAVLEDDVLVEHYVARHTQVSMVGNVYLGRVQNVLPSMEAAFVDIGKGRNAVLYAGEVNWEAAGLDGKPRRIEQALKSGDTVLVQVTKDPIGHKGARLTAQITLAGRHLVLVPSGAMTGISRKLPEKERQRLKKLLREIVPPEHGVIVRTAAEGATEEQLRMDVERLTKAWADIQEKSKNIKQAPVLLKGEPELAVRVVRDIFNEDFTSLRVQGDNAWATISDYVSELSPELSQRLSHWTSSADIFAEHRVDEQLAKAFDRKVWLPSGGTLVIDRTEAMTVIDVNTGKFTGAGGTLEETVTRNNLEAAEEIVRQLRLRDIGGIIVIDFIDMVLEENRELVLRRLVECLGRDRTRHQVAEVTSLGLVQMTRKRVGQGLVEAFSTTCEHCDGRGFITHTDPVERPGVNPSYDKQKKQRSVEPHHEGKRAEAKDALNSIAAASTKEGATSGHSSTEPHGEGKPATTAPTADVSDAQADSVTVKAGKQGATQSGVSGNDVSPAEPKRKRVRSKKISQARKAEREAQAAQEAEEAARAGSGAAEESAEVASSSATTEGKAGSGENVGHTSSSRRGTPTKSTHVVTSSGTITPGGGFAGVLSFPAS